MSYYNAIARSGYIVFKSDYRGHGSSEGPPEGGYGPAEQNPAFWASISPNSYLADRSGPVQWHHSVTDEEVPVASSKTLFISQVTK